MKLFAFTKTGIVRIVASSLMLSVYISTIILNFASDEITAGNFFATLLFIAAMIAFCAFSKMKDHPPLYLSAKGWLIASVFICAVAFIISSAEAEVSGFFGNLLGWFVMLFVSPFYGFAYLFKSSIAVSIIGALSCILIYFAPVLLQRASERSKLAKKYK